jgi:diguanylate cyclase (GGDEF)-like protein
MPSLLEELIEFAEQVASSIPSSGADSSASQWMQEARHFANECMIDSRLKAELEPFIPLRERGRFLDALKVIDNASRQVQGSGTEVRNSLTLVLELLRKGSSSSQAYRAWLREDQTLLDVTTLLSPKNIFKEDVLKAIAEAKQEQPLALMFVDVDEFKAINDKHGHQMGDSALAAIAAEIRKIADGRGKAYRYAGDEFTLLLPNATTGEAIATAERLRSSVDALAVGPSQIRVTVSIGVSSCSDAKMQADELIEQADAQMYKSKQAGRNQVSAEGLINAQASLSSESPRYKLTNSASPPPNLEFLRFPRGSFNFSDPNGDHTLALPNKEHLFLWVHPTTPVSNLSSKAVREAMQNGGVRPFGGGLVGAICERNTIGAFVCLHQNYTITQLTQVQQNCEIYGMDFTSIDRQRHMKNGGVSFGFIPTALLEGVFVTALQNYLGFASRILKLQLPLSFSAGLSGVRNFKLCAPSGTHFSGGSKFGGQSLQDNISHMGLISSYSELPASVLRPFFEKVWEEFGEDRPNVEQLG